MLPACCTLWTLYIAFSLLLTPHLDISPRRPQLEDHPNQIPFEGNEDNEARCSCCGLRLSVLNPVLPKNNPRDLSVSSRTKSTNLPIPTTANAQTQSTFHYYFSNHFTPSTTTKSADSSETSSPVPPRKYKMVQPVLPLPNPRIPTEIGSTRLFSKILDSTVWLGVKYLAWSTCTLMILEWNILHLAS